MIIQIRLVLAGPLTLCRISRFSILLALISRNTCTISPPLIDRSYDLVAQIFSHQIWVTTQYFGSVSRSLFHSYWRENLLWQTLIEIGFLLCLQVMVHGILCCNLIYSWFLIFTKFWLILKSGIDCVPSWVATSNKPLVFPALSGFWKTHGRGELD